MAPSHYLNQCWLITSKVQCHSFRAIWKEISLPSFTKISLKITSLKFHPNLPGPMSTYLHYMISFLHIEIVKPSGSFLMEVKDVPNYYCHSEGNARHQAMILTSYRELIVCFDIWRFKQAYNSEAGFGGHHCDFEQHMPCLTAPVCMNFVKFVLEAPSASILWGRYYSVTMWRLTWGGASIR